MQRFVYNPKAFIFIKRRNGDIADVSDYCTAGSVARHVGAVSTANFTLRNPDMIFTAKDGRHAAFYPMDPVTIYLQRLRDHPVRVFTGYLDETPYYELYPGVVEFSASCTLKKLMYTYFDPGLPYTVSFLSQYGWTPGGDGTIMNLKAIAATGPSGDKNADKDGGMGALLMGTLEQIGGWDKNTIKIEKLPAEIPERMANMILAFQEENKPVQKELEEMIKDFVGAGDYGNSGSGGSGGGGGGKVSTGAIKGLDRIIPTLMKAADKWGVPAEMIIATALIETGLSNHDSPGNPHYGWFQWDKKSGPAGSYSGWGVTRSMPEGCYDLGFSSDCYAEAAHGAAKAIPSLKNNTLAWTEKVQGVNQPPGNINNPLYPNTWSSKIAEAKSLISKFGNGEPEKDSKDASTANEPTDVDTQAQRRDGRDNKPKSGDGKIYAPIAGGTTTVSSPFGEPNHGSPPHTHMGMDVPCPTGTECVAPCDGRIGKQADSTSGFGGSGGMIHFVFTKDTGQIKKGTVIGWGHVGTCKVKPGQEVKGGQVLGTSNHPAPHVHFIMRTDENGVDGTTDPHAVFTALQKGETAPTSGGTTADDVPSTQTADEANANLMARTRATVLAAQLQWEGIQETKISLALQGNKSLMNDKPLLPYIQQLAEASLRQFMSMPNGDFFAFYPDYFGETYHRPPYWIIDDIEILEGSVRLNDSALVTHEFVIGDNALNNNADPLANMLGTAGVISIFNAFQHGLVGSETDKRKNDKSNDKATKEFYHAFSRILTQDEGVQFLTRYGARPDVQDYPFIKNPAFEMFMAFQRFMQAWSRQFVSPFKLTFMPELYPGGKVGFPEHGLQMYIEEVTHSWDYISGFVTEAELSSAAAMLDSNGHPLSKNLPPNMPTALLEVAAAKTTGEVAGPPTPATTGDFATGNFGGGDF